MTTSPPQNDAELLDFIKDCLENGKARHGELMMNPDNCHHPFGEDYHEGFRDACASLRDVIEQKEQEMESSDAD